MFKQSLRLKQALYATAYKLMPLPEPLFSNTKAEYELFKAAVIDLDWSSILNPLKCQKPHQTSWSEAETSCNSPAKADDEPDSDAPEEEVTDEHERAEDVPTLPQLEVCAFARSIWMLVHSKQAMPFITIYNVYQKERRNQTKMRVKFFNGPRLVSKEERTQCNVMWTWFRWIWKSL